MFLFNYAFLCLCFIIVFNSKTLNKLNICIKITQEIIANPPPIKPEKKLLNICNKILLIKLPNKEQGIVIKIYFKLIFAKLKFRCMLDFFIVFKFSKEIVNIDKK